MNNAPLIEGLYRLETGTLNPLLTRWFCSLLEMDPPTPNTPTPLLPDANHDLPR